MPWFWKREPDPQWKSMIDRENLIFEADEEDEAPSEDYDVLTSKATVKTPGFFHEGPIS